jgi:tRNA (guanine26-N2/guanine27-N2)-dimethyltransferase
VKLHREGAVEFEAEASGPGSGPGKAGGVFYNPAMAFARDLHVALWRKLAPAGTTLDGLAASGVRGLRLMAEAGAHVEFCDRSPLASAAIRANLARNSLAVEVHVGDLREVLAGREFGALDIDPFGTPVHFIPAAVRAVADGGVLGVAATDTAVLCGAQPRACERRYGALPLAGVAAKEVGLRILLGAVAREASVAGRGVTPLLCYAEGHHLRAWVRLAPGESPPLRWLSREMALHDAPARGRAGPLWAGALGDPDVFPDETELPGDGPAAARRRRLGRMLATLRAELSGPPGQWDMNEMARAAGRGETPARECIVAALRERGWFASSSIFHPLGIRTDAPLDEQAAAVQSL